jgi:hypothetical protein
MTDPKVAKSLDELDSLWISQEDMNSLTSQYGSIAKWNTNQQELKFVEATEPNLNFIDSDYKTVVFSIRSSGLSFNRDAFPNDSYEQAARRVADCITQHFSKTLNLKLNPYKDIKEKIFVANESGVQHNYEVDTWHWWMLECLDKIMKSPF